MKITTIILIKDIDPWRLDLALYALEKQTRRPDSYLVIDQNSTPENYRKYFDLVRQHNEIAGDYLHSNIAGEFHASRLSNLGASMTPDADIYVFTGVDEIPRNDAYEKLELIYSQHPDNTFCIERSNLRAECLVDKASEVKTNFVDNFKYFVDNFTQNKSKSYGSFQAIPKAVFNTIGGYDEDFKGWGFYDLEIIERAKDKKIPLIWLDSQMIHVWHESKPYMQKTIGINHKLYKQKRGKI